MTLPLSPFVELARARGAVVRSYGGHELVETFGDPLKECADVRAAAGIVDLSFQVGLSFSGADRATFLHNLLSNDIVGLRPGSGCYATLLTRESKIVSDARVLCFEDSIRLELDFRVKDRARQHLERFLVADDVEIEDRTESETALGVHGPRAGDVIAAAIPGLALPAVEFAHTLGTIGSAMILVVRVQWTGDPGYDLVVPRSQAADVWKALLSAGAPFGLHPIGMEAANILRVEAGIPWIDVDFDQSNLVLEAALERGINFRKGCYLGQEIVERASARGHVNKRLVGLAVEGGLTPRVESRILYQGRETGRITSAVFSPQLRTPIALGYVRREATAPGTRVEIESSGSAASAVVTELPFYRAREHI
jgi:folate-binding protein YgfZ